MRWPPCAAPAGAGRQHAAQHPDDAGHHHRRGGGDHDDRRRQGATDRVQEQMKGLGSNIMLVLPGTITPGRRAAGRADRPGLTEEDALAIAVEVPEVQVAAPSSRTGAQVVSGNANWSTSALRHHQRLPGGARVALESGRLFEAAEVAGSAKVAIIGQTTARELFGDADPLDQVIRIKKVPVTIIGVLRRRARTRWGRTRTTSWCCRSPPSATACRVAGAARASASAPSA
jgi:hypothetical protein